MWVNRSSRATAQRKTSVNGTQKSDKGERRTRRIESRIFEKRFSLELNSICEAEVEDRDDGEVVLGNVAYGWSTAVKVLLIRVLQFLVDAVDESRRREEVIPGDGFELTSGESTEIFVVVALDMIAE